jgi:hypothetical protein
MRHSLTAISAGPGEGPDLRSALEARRTRQKDARLAAADVEVEGRTLRLRGEPTRATPHAVDSAKRLTDAGGDLLVRLEDGVARAVLPGDVRLVDNLELVDVTLAALARIPEDVRVDLCEEDDGDLHLTLVAPSLARVVREGDHLYAGFYLASTETALLDTEACVRIFRVACRNGSLAEAAAGQRLVLPRRLALGEPDPYPTWQGRLAGVVERSFDGGSIDEETQRFRAATDEMLASPYEFLLNLLAQGLITEDEQEKIQRAFDEQGDASLYGFVNAVTSIAHGLRGNSRWTRAFALERLGGEIARGDHLPPVGTYAWA